MSITISRDLAYKLWAKTDPFHPLYRHLIDVGCVAQAILATPGMGEIRDKLAEALGCPYDLLPNWIGYLCALHDIGKCHHDFQGKGPQDLIEPLEQHGLHCIIQDLEFRHEGLSADWIFTLLEEKYDWPSRPARTVAACLRGHHGNFLSGIDKVDLAEIQHEAWETLRHELKDFLYKVFQPEDWFPNNNGDQSVFGMLFSGLLVWSDWIASNPDLFLYSVRSYNVSLEEYPAVSHSIAEATVAKLGLLLAIPWQAGETFLETWRFLQLEKPKPIQIKCEEHARSGLQPGLVIIEAPMGEGKTEAALYLATQWLARIGRGGFYIGLPTAATSNQMYERVKAFLNDRDVNLGAGTKLLHGQSWMVEEDEIVPENLLELDEETPQLALDWFRPKKRGLLAVNAVGTVDQALLSVLHVKHGFLRLFGLASKVLVIDEVHAYDPYMTKILTLLLSWCRTLQIPVLLLSATLPEKRRAALVQSFAPGASLPERSEGMSAPYPLLTLVDFEGKVKEVEVKGEEVPGREIHLRYHELLGRPREVAHLALELAANGGCLCIVANTVNIAQAIYQELQQLVCGTPLKLKGEIVLLLFHARFPAHRRREIEKEVLRLFGKHSLKPIDDPEYSPRPPRAILVATQVVEQSLDLDFDVMISEIAPIDLLLQRAGRLHRHARPPRPTGPEAFLHLLLPGPGRPDFGLMENRVYRRHVLLKTLAALWGKDRLCLPAEIRDLIETVYDGQAMPAYGLEISTAEDFEEAWRRSEAKEEDEANQARRYLIPEPSPTSFKLAQMPETFFEEDEGEAFSYFTARTRLGDDSFTVLALDGDEFTVELSSTRPPARRVLAEIMLNSVEIPRWWFNGVTPEPGFELPCRAPSWLPGCHILRFKEGEWRGREDENAVTILKSDELGLLRLRK